MNFRWVVAGGREVRRREKLRDDDPRDAQTAGKRKRPCADLNRDCWIQGPECWPLHHKATGEPSPAMWRMRQTVRAPPDATAPPKRSTCKSAHAGNRARGTSMEGLYVTTTLRVPWYVLTTTMDSTTSARGGHWSKSTKMKRNTLHLARIELATFSV